ncbi:unnamed protein product [Caenorhabditis brenneri]
MKIQQILPIFILFVCIVGAQGASTGWMIWHDINTLLANGKYNWTQMAIEAHEARNGVKEKIVEARDEVKEKIVETRDGGLLSNFIGSTIGMFGNAAGSFLGLLG